MKKLFINCMFTALTFGMLVSLNTMASETDASSSIIIGEENDVSLSSENAAQDGITAIQMSLEVETVENAKVSFDFNDDNNVKIAEFRYHEDTNTLNIYMADNRPIFSEDILDLGAVSATDTAGNSVDVKVSATENSLNLVSQNTFVSKTVKVESAAETTPPATEPPDPSEIVAVETTTTPTNPIDGESKSVEVEKTFATSYLINIPDGTDKLKENQVFTVEAENVLIKHGQTLKLSVTSENNWKLMDRNHPENDTGISYRMKYGDNATVIKDKTATILTIGEGKQADNVKLTVSSVDNPEMAGTFDDTLTFSVDIS